MTSAEKGLIQPVGSLRTQVAAPRAQVHGDVILRQHAQAFHTQAAVGAGFQAPAGTAPRGSRVAGLFFMLTQTSGSLTRTSTGPAWAYKPVKPPIGHR